MESKQVANQYLMGLIELSSEESNRFTYYARLGRTKFRVCYACFREFYRIGDSRLKKLKTAIIEEERTFVLDKRKWNGKELDVELKAAILDHIASFPTTKSHYAYKPDSPTR